MSEAAAANHTYVGTEHLLLGLLAEGKGVAAQVLSSFGVTAENARSEMRRILASESFDPPPIRRPRTYSASGQLSPAHGPMPASAGGFARVEIVMAEAAKVAVRAGADRVEPLHVAIGLLAHREGTAIAAIERMGCDIPRLAADLEVMVQPSGSGVRAEMVPIGPNLAPVMAAARNEQRASGAPSVATHHLLIALLETCPDVAQSFSAHGITTERLRDEARRLLG